MVRIVNGNIVPDDAPSQNQSQRSHTSSSSKPNASPFPSTDGRLGQLSQTVQFSRYQTEIIWPVLIVGVGLLFGIKWMLILPILLFVYNKNSMDHRSNDSSKTHNDQSRATNSQRPPSQSGFRGINDVRKDNMR